MELRYSSDYYVIEENVSALIPIDLFPLGRSYWSRVNDDQYVTRQDAEWMESYLRLVKKHKRTLRIVKVEETVI